MVEIPPRPPDEHLCRSPENDAHRGVDTDRYTAEIADRRADTRLFETDVEPCFRHTTGPLGLEALGLVDHHP
jgi:hypothetical protein